MWGGFARIIFRESDKKERKEKKSLPKRKRREKKTTTEERSLLFGNAGVSFPLGLCHLSLKR